MAVLDKKLDSHPSEKDIASIVELRIRNNMCFKELKSFNNRGKFLCEHPLLRQFSQRNSLTDLLRRNPAQFLEEYKLTSNNVARYKSFLQRAEIDPKQYEAWSTQLKKHQEMLELFTDILTHNGNNQSVQLGEFTNGPS